MRQVLGLVRSGDLRLVLWDNPIASYEAKNNIAHYDTYDQPLVNQHAMLAHFNTNTYLAFLDLDEVMSHDVPHALPECACAGVTDPSFGSTTQPMAVPALRKSPWQCAECLTLASVQPAVCCSKQLLLFRPGLVACC